ncbi:hypothetical protein Tcan_13938 [Toxocara canis]|uniref:Uncharacterized protein n=1 Tax=Toxocara canis TaxID=6265 RepID=A0A0B2V525_TOXCA|nr:hypothetical protein Tcan_13938 [Toxocara canis]
MAITNIELIIVTSCTCARSPFAMGMTVFRVFAVCAIWLLSAAIVFSDYQLKSTTLGAKTISENHTEKVQYKRSETYNKNELESENNCCIKKRCFTLIVCAILIGLPALVTILFATTLIVYFLRVRKRRNNRNANSTGAINKFEPINKKGTLHRSNRSSMNSARRGNKSAGSSRGQMRRLRNLCEESELSRSIMPSSSCDQESDERTLNDENPFVK